MPMEYKVKEKRLLFLHKILNMNEKRLNKKVYEQQKRPGLLNCRHKEVMSDLNMLDINRSEENNQS